jgi:hypothetical protein
MTERDDAATADAERIDDETAGDAAGGSMIDFIKERLLPSSSGR